jgi:hypothetical protein
MKILVIIGGLLGFVSGFLLSWARENSGSTCLWHACLAAYATATLFRWWGSAWYKNFAEAIHEKQNKPEPANPSLLSKLSKS